MSRIIVKILVAGILAVVVGGCASNSQMFINSSGAMYKCSSNGVGLIPAIQATQIQENCVRSIKAAGYVELESAGVIGMTISPASGKLRVIKIVDNSPAKIAGIQLEDTLTTINGVTVSTMGEVAVLLFGASGTSVDLKFLRVSTEVPVTLTRISQVEL